MNMRSELKSESVWDYPRPPRIDPDHRSLQVHHDGLVLAESSRTVRVLETSHPPVFYIPPEDIDMTSLSRGRRTTFCEFKGEATYWDLAVAPRVDSVGWSYERPSAGFEEIGHWIAFYPSKVECYVDGERVRSQEGDFYGGWITSEIQGPFKGGPGTWGW